MTPKLTPELRQAIEQQPGMPVTVEDPVTHVQYVLIELNAYERLQHAGVLDAGEPDPRAFYPSFASAVGDDLDDGLGQSVDDSASQP